MQTRQHATGNMRRGTCNRRHAACNTQQPDNMRDACGQYAANNNDMQRARQHAICSMQQTTDNVEKTIDSVQRTTDNKATGDKATCGRQQTPRKRQQPAGNASNGQRATDSRRHARGREHMRDATGNTRHRRISCAASSGQRTTSSMREALFSTTSAQHGTGATHKMQHTTGAAACSKHTRSRHHAAGNAMHGMRDETKGSRKLAHLDAASGSLRRPWGVEVGLSEFAEPVQTTSKQTSSAGSSTQRHGRQRQLPHPGHDAPRVASPARAVVLDVASKVPAPSAARPEVGSPGPPAGSGRGPALQGALLAGAVQRQGRARLGRPGPLPRPRSTGREASTQLRP